MKVGKPALDQGTYEVDCEARSFISPEQQIRIGDPSLSSKTGSIDHVSPIGGQGNSATGFGITGSRFCILTRKPADSDYSFFPALNQDQAHLQQDLQLAGNSG